MKYFLAALIGGLFLSSCSQIQRSPQPGTSTVVVEPSSTPVPVMTKTPTPNPTPAFTLSPTSANKTKITPTIKPTSTPIPTAIPLTHLDLPTWVSEPDADILFVLAGAFEDNTSSLVLINASNGGRFTLPTLDIGGYFWMPNGKQLGFLSRDKKEVTLVNVADGTVSNYPTNDKATRHVSAGGVDEVPYSYIAFGAPPVSPDFILLFKHQQDRLSRDGRYLLAEQDYVLATSVIDLETDTQIQVTDPKDDLYDYALAWSPRGSFLGVAQSNEEPIMGLGFSIIPSITLKVYDVANNKVIESFQNVTFPNWSPDGTKFLYQPLEKKYLGFWGSPPCIYDMLEGATTCYDEAAVRHRSDKSDTLDFTSLQWLPDQTTISYIYMTYDEGGLCFIQVRDGSERCILQNFEEPDQQIINYEFSPDGEFVFFTFDASCPLCDYSNNPQLAIANVHTGEYTVIGNNIDVHSPRGLGLGLWRPQVTP